MTTAAGRRSAAPAVPAQSEPVRQRRNPYIGPKPFPSGMRLPARERECRELAQLLVAERVVLLHAPSGAGKTSLVQAGLPPHLEQRRFVTPGPVRVNAPCVRDIPVRNRYVHSIATGLLGGREDLDEETVAQLSLTDVVQQTFEGTDRSARRLLVLDQFEEVLTLDPSDWPGQEEFFQQLGTMLEETGIWALMAMREDYMGGLHRYSRLVPGQFRTQYRLDFLRPEAARRAVQAPAAERGVVISDEAASAVVEKLFAHVVTRAGTVSGSPRAPYVEPVQLQVVCRRLWQVVRDRRGDAFTSIDLADVETDVDVKGALQLYYDHAVSKVARLTDADEGQLREWIEDSLIVGRHWRGQSLEGPTPHDPDPTLVPKALEEAYLIRGDTRADTTWYELTHDSLVEPVLESNADWRSAHLSAWRLLARDWHEGTGATPLLRGAELRLARREAADGASAVERDYLAASQRAYEGEALVEKARERAGSLAAVVVLQLVVIVVLAVLLLVG